MTLQRAPKKKKGDSKKQGSPAKSANQPQPMSEHDADAERILQLQNLLGNQAVYRLLQREDASDEQTVYNFAPMLVGSKKFFAKATRINKIYAQRLTSKGWPFLPKLIQLWQAGSFQQFAEAVWDFQVGDMGIDSESKSSDGILGPKTASAMQPSQSKSTLSEPPVSESPQAPKSSTPDATSSSSASQSSTEKSGISDQLSNLKTASGEPRTKKAKELVQYVRQQIESYPALIERFKSQSGISDTQKVKVIGEVAAAVGRMEFLLGTIFYKDKKWEETKNSGFMIKHYKEGSSGVGPWCSNFATKIRGMVTGQKMTASGYKVGTKSFYDYDSRGGALQGNTSTHDASSNSKSGNYSVWADLHDRLKKSTTDKQTVVENFFKEIDFQPQSGDIMVLKRSGNSAKANSFARKKNKEGKLVKAFTSHTSLIERVEGSVIHTIEGNSGDRVTGKTYDMAKASDVAKIVHISRAGLDSDATVSKASKKTAEDIKPSVEITRDILLDPVTKINKLLQGYAEEQKYINTVSDKSVDSVANMTKAGKSTSQT